MNLSRFVIGISAEQTIQESSQAVPVGVRAPSKPMLSATCATCVMYSRVGGRWCAASPMGMTVRLSPLVGRNQCSLIVTTAVYSHPWGFDVTFPRPEGGPLRGGLRGRRILPPEVEHHDASRCPRADTRTPGRDCPESHAG